MPILVYSNSLYIKLNAIISFVSLTYYFFQAMVVSFSLGIGAIPWIIMSEVPPLHYIFSLDFLLLSERLK